MRSIITIAAIVALSVIPLTSFFTAPPKPPVGAELRTAVDDSIGEQSQSATALPAAYAEFDALTRYIPTNVVLRLGIAGLREIKCLALNNYYEALSQGVEGMRAVTQVVLNRTEHEKFPGTACEAVYQRENGVQQFSWVNQSKKPALNTESPQWKDAVVVAKKMYVDGEVYHGLENALFYHATYVNPKWKRVAKVKRVGDHIFYRPIERAT